jgi:methionine-rich copper-binding protein CopC
MHPHVPGRGRPVTLLAAALAVIALALPATALGHAELDTITPANGSTVTESPQQIVATFTETLDPSKSSIVVVTAAGSEVASGGVVGADLKTMTIALPALEPGAYQVRWTSTSAQDGDLDRGTTGFTYAPAPTSSPTPIPAASATPVATQAATPSPSAAPAASPSPSANGQPASSSTADVLIPIIAAVVVIGGLGYWLLRGRSRTGGTP